VGQSLHEAAAGIKKTGHPPGTRLVYNAGNTLHSCACRVSSFAAGDTRAAWRCRC